MTTNAINERTRILASLLGRADAIWRPTRDWSGITAANTTASRRQFLEAGLTWASGRAGGAAQKESQRALEDLGDEGLVVVVRPNRVKTLFAKLTDAGDQYARALVGNDLLPGIDQALDAMADLQRYEGHDDQATTGGWLPETLLAGTAWGAADSSAKLGALQVRMLPALVRGWVKAGASCQGHAWYRLLPFGVEALANPPKPLANPPEWEADAIDEYLVARDSEASALANLPPTVTGEIGECPLPVSMPRRGYQRTQAASKP